jgi:hypothetical protein
MSGSRKNAKDLASLNVKGNTIAESEESQATLSAVNLLAASIPASTLDISIGSIDTSVIASTITSNTALQSLNTVVGAVSTVPLGGTVSRSAAAQKKRENRSDLTQYASKQEEDEANQLALPANKKAKTPVPRKQCQTSSSSSTSSLTSSSPSVNISLREIKLEPGIKLAEINRKRTNGNGDKVGNFGDFKKSLKKVQISKSAQSVSSSSNGKVSKNGITNQQYMAVDYKQYTLLGENNVPFVACITIANVYGIKDIIFGVKDMDDGEKFFWPSRMFYAAKIDDLMMEASISDVNASSFLRDQQKRPIIILSFMSKCDTNATFDDANNFLRGYIHGRIDTTSNTSPKKVYNLIATTTQLKSNQIAALVAISPKISSLNPIYVNGDDDDDDDDDGPSNIPVSSMSNGNKDNSDNAAAHDDNDDDDDDNENDDDVVDNSNDCAAATGN